MTVFCRVYLVRGWAVVLDSSISNSMIECREITKVYDNDGIKTHALRGVSLKISKGEFVAIMGSSGSGKSTLMHILGMLDSPTSGSFHFDNRDVSSLSDTELANIRLYKIGFVFQSFNLLPRTSVLRNVMLPHVYQGTPMEERKRLAEDALRAAGLTDKSLWTHLSNQLSGGQIQRVATARALANNPELIFADEPTGNLDSKSGAVVMGTFERLNKQDKRTIIVITHEKEVAEFADRIITLGDGLIESDVGNTKKRTSSQGLNL